MPEKMRLMEERDLDQIMVIERASFPTPWSRESYEGELTNQFATYYVVVDGDRVLGYAGVWCVFEEAHVTNVAVAADYRRHGLGRALMERLIERAVEKGAECIFLEVRPTNLAAVNLYRSLGFVPGGVRRGYYTDNNEDALVLIKHLMPGVEEARSYILGGDGEQ